MALCVKWLARLVAGGGNAHSLMALAWLSSNILTGPEIKNDLHKFVPTGLGIKVGPAPADAREVRRRRGDSAG